MEKLPDDFHKSALELIHHNPKDQTALSGSVQKILKAQFFKGEKVLVDGKELGTVVGICREDSPSNKENPPKYSVETQKCFLNSVSISKLKRVNSIPDTDIVSYISTVAQKPNSGGPWVVRKEYLDKHQIKDKVHPFFAMKRSASTSSNGASVKKASLEMNGAGPSHNNDSSSSEDDEPVIIGVRKSAVGMAPSSAAAKKMVKKVTKSPKPPKEPKVKKVKSPKKSKKEDKSPKKSKKSDQNGKQNGKPKSPSKKMKKNMDLSEFLTSTSKDKDGDSPQLSYEEKMANRAKNINKQAIKAIVTLDIPSLTTLMEKAAKSFPTKFFDQIPNEFVRYVLNKMVLKNEQKGKDAKERAKIRSENKDMLTLNEFSYLQRKLMLGKFEDTWIENTPLPDLQTIDCNQNLLFKCIRLIAFLQSYRQTLAIKKAPGLFEFIDSLSDGVDGFWKVTGPILVQVTDFIRRHQRTIPHFNNTGFLNYKVKSITTRSVHQIARKILNPDYNPNAEPIEEEDEDDAASVTSSHISIKSEDNADHPAENGKTNGVKKDETADSDQEDEDDDEALIDQQTKEDDELCERFSNFELFELTPLDQARILELLIERVEASGPVRDSMRNVDGEVKKLKESLVTKKKKIEKLNKDLEAVPPLISEEEYAMYTRAQTIGIVKQNRKRKELEDKIADIEGEICDIQDAIEEMRGCSRFRATPLGYDRYFRRYWFLPPTPGLLVEQGAWTTTQTNEEGPLALPVKPKFHSYDLSTEQLISFLRTLVNGGFPSDSVPVKWFQIDTMEKLDEFTKALNPKSVRESHLKEAIQKSQAVINASFKQRS